MKISRRKFARLEKTWRDIGSDEHRFLQEETEETERENWERISPQLATNLDDCSTERRTATEELQPQINTDKHGAAEPQPRDLTTKIAKNAERPGQPPRTRTRTKICAA